MKRMKQILAGLLVMAMLVTGLMITPMDAKAEETEQTIVKELDKNKDETGVIYVLDETNYKFSDYWSQDTKTAPVREDFVFGGWYTSEDNVTFTAITQTDAENGKVNDSNAWAKFVPAEVLSIRAQLKKETADNDGKIAGGTDELQSSTYLRLLSAVNGLNYQSVGFDIYYNKKHHEADEKATKITKVFETITNQETDTDGMKASELFGKAATHFSVLRLDDILSANFEKVIYVTPRWTTLDGTLVEGQGKYVRVMDGYESNLFISVPVNFFKGSAVAAGKLEMTYDKDNLEVVRVDLDGYDAGKQKTEGSSYNNAEAGKIQFVNNITGAASIEPESVVYANVWFKVKKDVTIASGTPLEFTVNEVSFYNWDENEVTDISAWDVKYLK